MKHHLIALAVGAKLLLLTLPSHAEEVLQVFLQGSSAPDLAKLVDNAGGEITHKLHIIDAVGAKLTRTQLDTVLESPLVSRFIDDLSDSGQPGEKEDEEKPPCRVRGHIELDFVDNGFDWRLYNKHAEPAQMSALNLDWPAKLGEITELKVGEFIIPRARYASSEESALKLEFPKASGPVITDISTLSVRFANSAELPKPRQRDFKLDASFAGPCSTDLVPGYENNHEDYYYNTVGGVDALHKQGITGKGVTVAVIDSGLWEHESLVYDTNGKNRLIARYDALTDTEDQEVVDESGHGTHMTSIIANSSKTLKNGKWTGTYKGVAPDANIVAVKVLDRKGLAHLLDIVGAVQWVVDNRFKLNIRIVNVSFAQEPRWFYWEDPVTLAIMKAWSVGITVVASSGNTGPAPMTIGSPGNLPYIITVGAVTDSWTSNTRDDDYIPEFSARGPTRSGHIKPDVVALGGHMTGLTHPNSEIAVTSPEDILRSGELVSTGSSQAAAFVTGALSLILELDPSLSPNELKCKLTTSAEPAIYKDGLLAYSPFQQGHGYVSVPRIVTLGKTNCESSNLDIRADIAGEMHFEGPAIISKSGTYEIPYLAHNISPMAAQPGIRTEQAWGVKSFVEQFDPDGIQRKGSPKGIDWHSKYHRERRELNKLADQLPKTSK